MAILPKYIEEVLVRGFDFTDDLAAGDKITNATVSTVTGDVEVSRVTHSDTLVTFWLSGGAQTGFQTIACVATTAAGEVLESRLTVELLA